MALPDYVVGAAFFLGTVGSVGLGAALVVRRRLAHLRGVSRLLAFALASFAGVVAVHLVPAGLGVLTRGTVLTAAVLGLAGASRLRRVPPVPPDPPPASGQSHRWSWVIAAVAAGTLAVYALAYLAESATVAVTHIDFLSFTMPGLARWIQSGSVWQSTEFLPYLPTGTYPNNGDTFLLAAVLPWRSDAFVRLLEYPLLAVIGCAVYALGRELGAARAHATLLAATVLALRSVTITAVENVKPDTFMLATFATGLVFLLRHHRTSRGSDLVLAGVGLGLAFGSRWYGVSSVVVVVVVWALRSALSRRALGAIVRQGAALVVLIALSGGFWFVRNWVVTGDPLFPLRVAPFGLTVFDAPPDVFRERYGFTIAHYALQPRIWAHFILPGYRAALGLPGLVVVLGLLLAVGLVLAGRRARSRPPGGEAVLTLAAMAALVALAYAVTPAGAQGFEGHPFKGLIGGNARWLMPAAIPAAAASAWALGRLGRGRLVAELAALVAVGDGIRRTFELGVARAALAALVLGLVVGVGALAVVVYRRVAARQRRYALVAAGVLALGLIAVGGHALQRRLDDGRFRGSDATIDWVLAHAPSGHAIGLAGDWRAVGLAPVLPMFGPRLGNHVSYVGPLIRGMLEHYRTRGAFLAAVHRGGYDLLLVGRAPPPPISGRPALAALKPLAHPQAEVWARSAGFVAVARSERFVLLRAARDPA